MSQNYKFRIFNQEDQKMRSKFTAALSILMAIAIIALSAGKAAAIPAFARQNSTECSTCHTIFPELNEYGEVFYKNSFVMASNKLAEKKAAQAHDNTPEGIKISGVPLYFPASVTVTQNLAYDDKALDGDKLDLASRAVVLEAGGSYNEDAGFFLSYNLYTQGIYEPKTGNTPLNNTPQLNEAFVVWRHALDTPVNIKAGRMKPKLSLWKSSNKSAISTYAPLIYKVGDSPFYIDAPEDAIEANAILANRFFVAGGVVDRNGQNSKEGYGHISVKIGGADLVGNEPAGDFDNPNFWDFASLTIGAYGYSGKITTTANPIAKDKNNYYRAGVDADFISGRFRARAGAVWGEDSNPFLAATIDPSSSIAAPTNVKSTVVSAEGQYLLGSTVLAAIRYEYQDSGPVKYSPDPDQSPVLINIKSGKTHRYIPSITFAPKQSIKVALEYKYEDTPVGKNNVVDLGLVFSF
jgi:hypothetical protein